MCVLRERIRGEKSVISEHGLESLHPQPQETTGVFCWDPQSHMSQGMGTPSNQAKFLPLLLLLWGGWDFPEVEGKSRARKHWSAAHSLILTPPYRLSLQRLLGKLGGLICTIPGGDVCPSALRGQFMEAAMVRIRWAEGERALWGQEKGKEPLMLESCGSLSMAEKRVSAVSMFFEGCPSRDNDIDISVFFPYMDTLY